MAGVSNESRFDKIFLEAVAYAFKQCALAFSPKSEQLDAIYAVVTGKDAFVKAATGFKKSVARGSYGGRVGRCWRRKIQNFDFVAREFK